jgi:hypothetical protein
MKPLTCDDLISLEEYAGRRREFFESHLRYLDRYRRVRIGPRLTLIFENRQTLWFRVQEIVRVARLADPAAIQEELDLYNDLLPIRNQLHAALLIDAADDTQRAAELAAWSGLHGSQLVLAMADTRVPATLVTSRPEDRCHGTAHWVQLHLDTGQRRLLADLGVPAVFSFDNGVYQHHSAPLNDDLRQSLLEDLQLSDRDQAA